MQLKDPGLLRDKMLIDGVFGGESALEIHNPATGAVIGGAVGAVGGAATSPCDVDLNAPGGRRDCR